MPSNDQEKLLLSIKAAAAQLGVSPQTLRRYMQKWGLTPVRLGRRVLLKAHEVEKVAR